MSGFAQRFRKLRLQKDVTQQKLAEFLEVKSAAVSKYETGNNNYPRPELLIKLADYFGVSIDYLLRGEEFEPSVKSINNSSVNNSFQQANNGGIIMNSQSLSPEVAELVRIYGILRGRDRFALIEFALSLERKASEGEEA